MALMRGIKHYTKVFSSRVSFEIKSYNCCHGQYDSGDYMRASCGVVVQFKNSKHRQKKKYETPRLSGSIEISIYPVHLSSPDV
jgi:hypothetical protein